MNTKPFRNLLTGVIFLAAVSAGFAAKDASKKDKDAAKDSASAPVANKKADLHVDPSPVSDGKSAVVTSYADVVEPVQKAVVSIYSTKIVKERIQMNPLLRQFFGDLPDQERSSKQEGLGSGVIVTADGYILTNNHVVEGADELKVSLSDDREFTAKVIGTDPKTDIAVVKIEATKLPIVTLADSDKLRVGDVVFAVGNPLGVGQTVTMGIVSAKGRTVPGLMDEVGGYQSFIQTDAAINMGNSGGALIDAKGRLVGINSAILSPTRGNIGIGFAIPTNLAASIMNSLIETGAVSRGYLGIFTDSITPDVAEQLGLDKDTHGAFITDISSDSPAEKIGLKRNDAVIAVNDRPVTSSDDLRLTIAQMMPGTAVKLKLMRDGKEKTISVTLGKLTENPNELFAGVTVKALTNEDRRRLNIESRIDGLLVTAVADDSPYHESLIANMVIMEINRTPVTDLAAARSLVRPDRNLVAFYYRNAVRIVVLNAEK